MVKVSGGNPVKTRSYEVEDLQAVSLPSDDTADGARIETVGEVALAALAAQALERREWKSSTLSSDANVGEAKTPSMEGELSKALSKTLNKDDEIGMGLCCTHSLVRACVHMYVTMRKGVVRGFACTCVCPCACFVYTRAL